MSAYKFSSNSTHDSKSCEGVKYKLRKFTEGRRIKMALALAPAADKITDLRSEMAELNAKFRPMVEDARRKSKEQPEQKEEIERELDTKLASDPDFVRIDKFNGHIRRIEDNEMNIEYVKHMLMGVEGLEIDGNENPTVEQIIEDGPPRTVRRNRAPYPARTRAEQRRNGKLRIAWHFQRTGDASNDLYNCSRCEYAGDWQHRGCIKRHPEHPLPRNPWWFPVYQNGNKPVTIEGVAINECPKSLVTPQSNALVEIFTRAEYAHEGSGASLFGPNLSKWHPRMVDALKVVEQEKNRYHSALTKRDAD
jgi:hypothetical protein